ncbi:hypothetical protein DV737_g3997, partial [Chaetothyriales sp. CBS 132003]
MGTEISAELELQNHSLTEADLDAEFALGPQILPRLYESGTRTMKLKDILAIYERAYCGAYGVEFQHIHEQEKRTWIQDRIELENPIDYSKAEKTQILDRLIWSSNFERFLATKYPNEKRYGLEGGESYNAGIKALVDASVEHGVDNIVIGSQHRGRMSLLTNLVRKPLEEIFQEFSLGGQPSHPRESGDVRSHLGFAGERTCPSGKKVKISLLPNPSHLEADDPVAAGKTKALQHLTGDKDHSKTMCLTFHGDAAVTGQGVVYETLTLSRPPAFNVGGTIHVIVNNQIGFTTDPAHSRSSMYCSDVAKTINAPIFHVNADDVEAVTFVSKLAAEWRAKFKSDVFIDLVCYRKFGHNEMDQPLFTQPVMYGKITAKKPVLEIYIEKLLQDGQFSAEEIDAHKREIWNQMAEKFEASREYERHHVEWNTTDWPSIRSFAELAEVTVPAKSTAINESTYAQITNGISVVPDCITVHQNVGKAILARRQSLEEGKSIDWSSAEALAFGSLLLEGTHVRVSALVICFSKSLLRHPFTKSPREDFLGDSTFREIISDPKHGKTIDSPEKIRRVILCSGQVYAALFRYRQEHSISNVAITRIEQLHPFPFQQAKENLNTYGNAAEIIWCQEEPMNGGAWEYVQGRLQTVLKETDSHGEKKVKYVGRDPSAATATGFKSVHEEQAKKLMEDAFAGL